MQDDLYFLARRSGVVREWTAKSKLTLVDGIYSATCSLNEADPLEGVSEDGIAGPRGSDEQIRERHTLNEATRVGKFNLFAAPLNVNGAGLSVVAVDERVVQRLAKTGTTVVRNTHAEKADLDLSLLVPSVEPGSELFSGPEKRAPEEVVDGDA